MQFQRTWENSVLSYEYCMTLQENRTEDNDRMN